MCGIVGYVTSKPGETRYKAILSQGLWADTFRGACGTGIYGSSWKPDAKSYTYKRALEGPDFLRTRQFDDFVRKMYGFNVVIGHNRAATIGTGEDENCHPFQFGPVGLVHNGTLQNYRELVADTTFTHAVDSAYAAKALSETENPTDVLGRIRGPYVLVWHNTKTGTFHIARNNNRDIWWITDKDNTALFFASEWGLLQWLLDRNGVDYGRNMFKCPKEHSMLTWDLTKPIAKGPKITQYEEIKPPPPKYPEHSGFQGTTRRAEWNLMTDWELTYNDEVLVKVELWKPYDGYTHGAPIHNKMGYLMGRVIEPSSKCDGVAARLHRVSESEGMKFLEDGWAEGRVTGATTGLVNPLNSKEEPWINVSDPVLPKRLPTVVPPKKEPDKDPKKGDGAAQQAAKEVSAAPKAVIVVNGETLMTGDKAATMADMEQGGDSPAGEMFPGPDGVLVTAHEFREEVRGGCCYCGDPLNERDADTIEWVSWGFASDSVPLCIQCQRPEIYHELAIDNRSGSARH